MQNTKCWQRCRAPGSLMRMWSGAANGLEISYKIICHIYAIYMCVCVCVYTYIYIYIYMYIYIYICLVTAIYLPYNSAVLLLDIDPREIKPYVYTKTGAWMFLAALFIMVWNWNQPKCPSTDEWINRLWYIHTIAKQLSNKKEWIIDS